MRDLEEAKDKVMLGVERRSLVLSEDERRLTAYHEAGHALLSLLIPGLDPLHKVTIVPRGRALGLTFSLPEEDRHSYPRVYVEGRLVVAYGGRVAEELAFGPDRVTTGGARDFEQATQLARRMVTEFGMSDVIGPVGLGDHEPSVFVGREPIRRRELSDRTAELIDTETRRLVNEAYARARTLLSDHVDQLHAVARALLDRETLTGDEVQAVAAAAQPGASVVRETVDAVAAASG
jgi:cell division protease FtsH